MMLSNTNDSGDLAAVRDRKFQLWLKRKSIRDKGLTYLGMIDTTKRAESEKKLLELGVAVCCIDRLVGEDEEEGQKRKVSFMFYVLFRKLLTLRTLD